MSRIVWGTWDTWDGWQQALLASAQAQAIWVQDLEYCESDAFFPIRKQLQPRLAELAHAATIKQFKTGRYKWSVSHRAQTPPGCTTLCDILLAQFPAYVSRSMDKQKSVKRVSPYIHQNTHQVQHPEDASGNIFILRVLALCLREHNDSDQMQHTCFSDGGSGSGTEHGNDH